MNRKPIPPINADFLACLPYATRLMGGGQFWQAEKLLAGLNNACRCGVIKHHCACEAARVLDVCAHIDYLHDRNRHVRGVSFQCSNATGKAYPGFPYDNFTIRKQGKNAADEEFKHLRDAYLAHNAGLLTPMYHIQAHVKDGVVHSIGRARMRDIIEYIVCPPPHCDQPQERTTWDGGSWFYGVTWAELVGAGITVDTIYPPLEDWRVG